jgi:hypothetical protein
LTGGFTDPDGVNSTTVSYVWQMEVSPGLFSDPATGVPVLTDMAPQVGRAVKALTDAIFDVEGLGQFQGAGGGGCASVGGGGLLSLAWLAAALLARRPRRRWIDGRR